ncbi:sporulation integral membrane protein YtvI [Desulfitobacterium dichloroeliminans LMG P-21439]|uniref:Sporulation integral membrane protein YtvI n=1 Tax=Desulfitobacterium dichloroeliminans (strain LMG P-21439 / DCA1) TaxID=871963 RepID=L0F9Y8_DESDL|nr:sporulation integral membrane protein YtvI [Desulfitobacterium dichloroeliminans]AGA70007.1 sporulation integral membrane protein YtvI [Desulfitobacterium dichloroeliminans LMG P-21439]
MDLQGEQKLKQNINRLAVITFVLVLLKVVTFFFKEFMPVFSELMSSLISAFLPFLIAFFIALLLEPLVVRFMLSLKVRRPIATLFALLIAILGIGSVLFLIVVRLYTELSDLAVSLPSYGHMVTIFNNILDTVENFIQLNPQVQITLNNTTQGLMDSLQGWALTGSLLLLNFISALPGVFIVLVISVVATFFMSASYPVVKSFFGSLLPGRWRPGAQSVSRDLGVAVVGFVRAEAILISVTGVILTVGLVWMGNPYAFTIGFISAFLDLLPIVGTGMVFIPWIVGLFILGSVSEGIKLLVLYLIATVIRQLLEPKVMSQNIGIHPLATLISMYVGLKLLGGLGLILGPGLVIVYEAIRKAGFLKK